MSNAIHFPSYSAVSVACDWILDGDLDRARAELGHSNYALAPDQAVELREALEAASVKFNAPELANRNVLAI